MPQLEAQGSHALSIMDRMVHNFAEVYPDFVAQYRRTRIILHLGTRHEDGADDGVDEATKD